MQLRNTSTARMWSRWSNSRSAVSAVGTPSVNSRGPRRESTRSGVRIFDGTGVLYPGGVGGDDMAISWLYRGGGGLAGDRSGGRTSWLGVVRPSSLLVRCHVGSFGSNISSCSHVTATSLTTCQRSRPREPGRRISTRSARNERADPSGSRIAMLPSCSIPTTRPTTQRPLSVRRNRIGSSIRSPSRASEAGDRCMCVGERSGQAPMVRRCNLRIPPSQRSGSLAFSAM